MAVKINTNFPGLNIKEVSTTVLEQSAAKIESVIDFPNGFKMHSIVTSEGVTMECNWELRQESDGSLTPIPPKEI